MMKLFVLALLVAVVAGSETWREGTPDPRCQQEDAVGTHPNIFPHDTDCASFYICSRGSRCELYLNSFQKRKLYESLQIPSDVTMASILTHQSTFAIGLQMCSAKSHFMCKTIFNKISCQQSRVHWFDNAFKSVKSGSFLPPAPKFFVGILSVGYKKKAKMFFPFRSIILEDS